MSFYEKVSPVIIFVLKTICFVIFSSGKVLAPSFFHPENSPIRMPLMPLM